MELKLKMGTLVGTLKKHPAMSYFVLSFFISWTGAFILIAPKLVAGQSIPKMDGVLMFPIMLIGPVAASFILNSIIYGKPGVRSLQIQIFNWKAPVKWYIIALITPPSLILITLTILQIFVSPVFKPNFFPLGFLFGIPAGFFEEIGWTGFAYPNLRIKFSPNKSALLIGGFWGLWHLPVVDFLGAANPHKQYLLPFFLAFIAVLMAIRIIMTWLYSKTNSIPLMQFMHIVSTGCLVTFGPFRISPGQEALWYASYAMVLWILILICYGFAGKKENSLAF